MTRGVFPFVRFYEQSQKQMNVDELKNRMSVKRRNDSRNEHRTETINNFSNVFRRLIYGWARVAITWPKSFSCHFVFTVPKVTRIILVESGMLSFWDRVLIQIRR